MGEKLSEVFECYNVHIVGSSKGRYAQIIETDAGAMQLRPMETGESRLRSEYVFKERLYEEGFENIDRCVMNTDEELFTPDRYGNCFVMRRYFQGREMSSSNMTEVMMAVENLAYLHRAGRRVWMRVSEESSDTYHVIRDDNDFQKRNRELKRVRGYIGKVSPKQKFEELYIKVYEGFYAQALECERRLRKLLEDETYRKSAIEHIGYCHGNYNNHSVLMCHREGRSYVATTGFDRFYVGNQLADLYYFSRKIVEKNGYDFNILKEIIETYNSYIPLSYEDLRYMYLLFAYPEKFYKLSSQYINSSKMRISPVFLEKIGKIISGEEKKRQILDKFRNIFLHI